jgi:hypothetical protein
MRAAGMGAVWGKAGEKVFGPSTGSRIPPTAISNMLFLPPRMEVPLQQPPKHRVIPVWVRAARHAPSAAPQPTLPSGLCCGVLWLLGHEELKEG